MNPPNDERPLAEGGAAYNNHIAEIRLANSGDEEWVSQQRREIRVARMVRCAWWIVLGLSVPDDYEIAVTASCFAEVDRAARRTAA